MQEVNCVKDGDYCILKKDEDMIVIQVESGDKTKRFKKQTVQISSLIGKVYGQWVEIKNSAFVDGKSPDEIVNEICKKNDNGDAVVGDNRNLVANNDNQQLSDQEIAQMKNNGMSGEEIIRELLNNSGTYDTKTAYSQEKYVKKKISKHIQCFQILEASPVNLCESFSLKGNFKAGRIREDTLSYIMYHIDIRGSVGVMENCNGLILGNVLRASTPNVKIYNVTYGGEQPTYTNILAPERKTDTTKIIKQEMIEQEMIEQEIIEQEPIKQEPMICEDSKSSKSKSELKYGFTNVKFSDNCLPPVDSLVVVSDVNPNITVPKLFPSLKKSGSFVVYSQYLDRLAKLFNSMWKSKAVVFTDIIEPFTRTIQVLPNRTHPNVTMDSNAGYILFGIKVGEIQSDEPIDSQPTKSLKKKATQTTPSDVDENRDLKEEIKQEIKEELMEEVKEEQTTN
ncbi:tRNA (adenine(58)-N(1))-methyltransferase non-catalytic subunit TRM6 [Entamoeba marina]